MRVVVDTNVVFQGLTEPTSSAGELITLWLNADPRLEFCMCNPLYFEYVDVISRLLSPQRYETVQPLLGDLLRQATEIDLYFSWRPASRDPGDEHVIDCAQNARAVLVTYNERDFRQAREELGLVVMTPEEALDLLTKGGQ